MQSFKTKKEFGKVFCRLTAADSAYPFPLELCKTPVCLRYMSFYLKKNKDFYTITKSMRAL